MDFEHFLREANTKPDYTTNAGSYYKDLARKQELIKLLAKRIWEYEELLDTTLENLSSRLESYINENDALMTERLKNWDERIENLDEEVSHIFIEWLNDGTLEQIINHDVLGNKADTKDLQSISKLIYPTMTQEEIQSILDSQGTILFTPGNYTGSYEVGSHSHIMGDRAFFKTDTEKVFAFRLKDDTQQTTIEKLDIYGENGYQVGIGLGLNNKHITIKNNTIHNLSISSNKQVIGIVVPSLGCENVTIEKNTIEHLYSEDDGIIGTTFGGWCKAISITVGLNLYTYDYKTITMENITKNVTVKDNYINDIGTAEDGDGIHVDVPFTTGSTVQDWKLDYVFENNFLKNCGKRFFKIMVAGGVTIKGNTGVHTLDTPLRTCISTYSKRFIIENNSFYNRGTGYIRYGIEFGLDEEKYTFSREGKGIIKNNFMELGIDDHLTGKQSFGITFNDASQGYYNTILIDHNYIQCGYKPIYFPTRSTTYDKENGMISHLEITNNTIETGASTLHVMELNVPTNNLIVKQNHINSFETAAPRSSPVSIGTQRADVYHNHVIFNDNYFGYTVSTIRFNNISVLMAFDNIVNNVTSAGFVKTNVLKVLLKNNYGIFNEGIFS